MQGDVELAFQESLKSSVYGWIRKFSTPTITGRGVNKWFAKSDMRYWMYKCPCCGEWQTMTFEDNIKQVKDYDILGDEIPDGSYEFLCIKCGKPLNRWEAHGEYVALHPDKKEIRGYQMSQLAAVWITADDIMRRQKNYTSKQLFYNYVLGFPFESMGLVITEADIRDSICRATPVVSRTKDYVHISVGIDWGQVSWMIIMGTRKNGKKEILDIFWFKENPLQPLEPVSRFIAILKAYQPDIIIADAGYGADKNSYMYQNFPDAFYSCQFITTKNPENRVRFVNQWNESSREVTVDKTTQTQRMLHVVKARGIGTFEWDDKIALYSKHMQNVRILDQEENQLIYQLATRIGPDHLACATIYALIGFDKILNYGVTAGFAADFI